VDRLATICIIAFTNEWIGFMNGKKEGNGTTWFGNWDQKKPKNDL
jgi:hypothetical protein